MRKTSNLLIEKPVELDEHHEEADILFIGSYLVKVLFKKVLKD